MNKRFLILTSMILLFLTPVVALADDEDDSGQLPQGTVRSTDAILSPHAPADQKLQQSEYARLHGYYDLAIKYAQNALIDDPDDIDSHVAYAEALEAKLHRQKQKDFKLFMASVREWLLVSRAERGEEKGLTNSHGLGIPGMQYLYQDSDRHTLGNQHLKALVGWLPKVHETDHKYLDRVEKAAQEMVDGKVVDKDKKSDTKTATAHSATRREADHSDGDLR